MGEKLRIDRFLVSQVQVNQSTQVGKLLTRFWDQNLKPDQWLYWRVSLRIDQGEILPPRVEAELEFDSLKPPPDTTKRMTKANNPSHTHLQAKATQNLK